MREDISVTNTGASSFHVKPNSHVLFSISLIQDEQPDAQTGEEFDQMANDIMANPNVTEVTLLPVDTLQRFRFMLKDENLTEDDAIAKTKELYNNFLERNAPKIEEMHLRWPGKFSIIEWDYYRNTNKFREVMITIEEYYKTAKNFKDEVNNCVENYVKKLKQTLGDKYNYKRAWELMTKYVFEEAAFQIVAGKDDEKDFHYEYYRTQRNRAMRNAHNTFVRPYHPDRMRELYYSKPKKQTYYSLNNTSTLFALNDNQNPELELIINALRFIVNDEARKLHVYAGVGVPQMTVRLFSDIVKFVVTELPLKYGEKSHNGQSTQTQASLRPEQTSIQYQ